MPTIGGKELLNPQKVLAKLQIKRGNKVADFGCGPAGHFTIPLAGAVGSHGQVYAIDVLKSALEAVESRARQEGVKNIKIIWSNFEIAGATSIAPASLDAGVLVNVLYQSEKRQEIFKEIHRLLKSSGKLGVIDWRPEAAVIGPAGELRLSAESVKKYASQAGFTWREDLNVGSYHYGLIFEKT